MKRILLRLSTSDGGEGCRTRTRIVLFPKFDLPTTKQISLSPRFMYFLDYAATAAVRPRVVADAVHLFLLDVGASPGRGGYALSVESGRIAFRARRLVARILGVSGDPGRVAFMLNATHALNTAIRGVLRPGDRVVVTAFDHNAVLRPTHDLALRHGVGLVMIPGSADGSLDMAFAAEALEGARLLVVNAVSNVLGTRLPLEELARLAHERGALVLVDAAQSAGQIPESAVLLGADMVAFTGHKSLLGPQGTGGLWVREGVDVHPLCAGGTGGDSSLREMPDQYPDHLEAGTPNAAGLAGLLAGCEFLLSEGVEAIHHREAQLKARLWDGLDATSGIRVLSPPAPDGAAVVTVTVDGLPPAEVARQLEHDWQVLCRAGLHCAPEAHRILGSKETGALRLSLGWASTPQDVDRALEGLATIAHALRPFAAVSGHSASG